MPPAPRKKKKPYKPPVNRYDPTEFGCRCSECPLRNQGNQVPAKTPRKVKLVVLGEAPGMLEESRRQYFVGESGLELEKALEGCGISRSDIHISNCLQCRPRSKTFSNTNWKKAIECCWPRLEDELVAADAPVVLGLGKWSQWTLRGKTDPIHDWCGSPYPIVSPYCTSEQTATEKEGKLKIWWEKENAAREDWSQRNAKRVSTGKKPLKSRPEKHPPKHMSLKLPVQRVQGQCVTTYHPAFALSKDKQVLPVFYEHFERAWKLACGELKPWKWPKIYAKDDKAAMVALEQMWKDVKSGKIKRLGLDIETAGSNPVHDMMTKVGLSSKDVAISLSWPLRKDAIPLVKEILAHPCAKAAHNGTHDLIGFERVNYEVNGYEYDTIIQQAIWVPTLLRRLQFACCLNFHMPAWKKEFKMGGEEKGLERFLKADPLELGIYNAKDAYMTLILSYALEERLKDEVENHEELYRGYLARSLISKEMRKKGVLCSQEHIKSHMDTFTAKCDEVLEQFKALAAETGLPIEDVEALNLRSPLKTKNFFFLHLKAKAGKKSDKTGLPSLDEDALRKLMTDEDKRVANAARLLKRYRIFDKLIGFLKKLQKKRVTVIHADGQCWGTKTGRWAYKDPNLTTIPKARYEKNEQGQTVEVAPSLRDIIRAREGMSMVEVDFCVDPMTKILTTDLLWKNAVEIKEGDELIGFPEQFSRYGHTFRPSVVEKTKWLVKRAYRIITDRGEITVSEDHNLVRRNENQPRQWVQAKDLIVGDQLSFWAEPWEVDRSYDAGWLAGFFDGEGYVTNQSGSVAVGQNEGATLQKCRELLRERGYTWAESKTKTGCVRVQLTGCNAGVKLLGEIRPGRLLTKAGSCWNGRQTWGKRSKNAIIQKIEYISKQKVIAIQTSTKTFIANGFLSHNCQLEGRVLAYLANDQGLINIFENNLDLHTENAKMWFSTDNPTKFQRNLAKTLMYGMNYGGGAKTIYGNLAVDYPDLTLQDIEFFIKLWYLNHPALRIYQRKLLHIAKHEGVVRIPLSGKTINTLGELDPPKIYNPPIQGCGSFLIDRAIEQVWAKLDHSAGETILIQVHDALIGEGPDPHRLARIFKQEMEKPVTLEGREVWFPCDCKKGPSWGELKEFTP